MILGRISERAKELETSTQQLHDMNGSFAELMSTVETTLAFVDEKVCQASPLYSGPSAEDITNSFRELEHDVEGLSTLKSMTLMNHKRLKLRTHLQNTATDEEVEASPISEAGRNPQPEENMDSSHACSKVGKR